MANDEGVHLGRIGRAILAGVEGFVGGVATEEACPWAGGEVLERQAESAVDPIVAATPKSLLAGRRFRLEEGGVALNEVRGEIVKGDQ